MWIHRDINLPAPDFVLRSLCLVRYGHLHFLLLGPRAIGFYYQAAITSGKSWASLPGAQLRNLSEDSLHPSQPSDFSPGNLREGLWGWAPSFLFYTKSTGGEMSCLKVKTPVRKWIMVPNVLRSQGKDLEWWSQWTQDRKDPNELSELVIYLLAGRWTEASPHLPLDHGEV